VPPCLHAARGSLPTPAARQVRSFARGQGKSEQTIGALAGLLAAAGPFPRSISSFPWGVVSDRIGRKVPSPATAWRSGGVWGAAH
jgi:MFS family permease